MTGTVYISVIGPGQCSEAEYEEARAVGRLVAACGAVLVCGGLGGVMEGAARGAREAGGLTLGILPASDRAVANPFIDHAVPTGLGEARDLAVVSAGDAVIAVGGGYGTLAEIGLAGKIGRPVVILRGWRLDGAAHAADIEYASSPADALALVHERLGRTYSPATPEAR